MKTSCTFIIFGIWLSCSNILIAQNYSISNINSELLKNANAVVRLQEHIFTVTDTGKAEYSEHAVITVLNKNGDQFASLYDSYDKFEKITEIKGKIYNSEGKVIRKIKSSDFTDQSAISDYTLFADNRVKYFIPLINTYPYTVEYENSGVINGLIDYPTWRPQYSFDLAVESSTYKITIPKNFNLHFKKLNYDGEPQNSESSENKTYLFKIDNLKAVEKEDMSPGISEMVPIVYVIPEYFKIDNYTGSNKSWKSFGEWDQKLNQQENKLSPKTKADLAEIKAKATDQIDLIKKVYEYMQSKTRYVSIQLGIGGWRPFDASVVDKYGYGDCKALSNYMKSLLREVGIESIYTLAHAGSSGNDIIYDETFNQFNHAILCVPYKNDTIWLECTSQLNPYRFLGDFTDNRHVLLITNEGGVIVKTPKYTEDQNTQIQSAEITLATDGNAEGFIKSKCTGLQYDDNSRLLYSPPDKQKEILYKKIGLPSFIIKNFHIDQKKEPIPWFDENVNITISNYASTMGNRLLLPLNLMNKSFALPPVMKERKTRFQLRYAYTDRDSIIYHLPAGYTVEFMPPPFELNSEFGTYSVKLVAVANNNSLVYIRIMTRADGYFAPEKYKDYVVFIRNVSKQDNIKISLIKAH